MKGQMDAADMRLRVVAQRTERLDAVSLLRLGEPSAVVSGPDGGVIGWGSAYTYRSRRWEDVFTHWEALSATFDADSPVAPRAVVSLTFDPTRTAWESVLVVPQVMAIDVDGASWLVGIGTAPTLPSDQRPTASARWSLRRDDANSYADRVAACLQHLSAGEAEKVVVAAYRDWESVGSWCPADLLVRLAEEYSDCWLFALDGFVGASPELLTRVRSGRIESRVLAGSVAPDDLAALDDPTDKLHREHALAAASAVESLSPLSSDLTASEPHVLSLSNVAHLATTLTGTLREDVDIVEVLERLHPTAAVGGTPTSAAVALLHELEGFDRGRYAGPVGWIDTAGDGEFVIGLRSGQQMTSTSMRMFAGAGIVDGSRPANERAEINAKFEPMESALGLRDH